MSGGELNRRICAYVQRMQGKISGVQKNTAPILHVPYDLPSPAIIDLQDMRQRLVPVGEGIGNDVGIG